MKSLHRIRTAAALGAVAAGLAGSAALADHAWSTYHWQTVSGVATPLVVDNTVGAWKPRVALAVQDWHASAQIESVLPTGKSEERRVGKDGCNTSRFRVWADPEKKKKK